MIIMNSILLEDLENLIKIKSIDWEKFNNKKIFITGATGLIGSIMVKAFLLRNNKYNSNIKLILPVRNIESARQMFEETKNIEYMETNVENYESKQIDIDYIIHMASPTKSKFMVSNPVETINIAFNGTKNILEQAKISNIKSFIYVSSMEMYGVIDDQNVTEDKLGYINNLTERSSYPEGKRIGELLSYSFFKEYSIPVKIARLAQTFGAGINKNETRVYKIFCDSILQEKDIILKTKGSTIINYCYTTDAIIGILKILLDGKNGEAYNVVSDNMNLTILDSAKWLTKKYTNDKIKVKIELDTKAFAPDNKMILNNEKIKSIGWKAQYNVYDGYDRLIKYLKEENNEE